MFPLLKRLSLRLLVLGRALQLDLAEELLQLFLSLRIDLRFEFRDLELSLLPDRLLCGMKGFVGDSSRWSSSSSSSSTSNTSARALERMHVGVDHIHAVLGVLARKHACVVAVALKG